MPAVGGNLSLVVDYLLAYWRGEGPADRPTRNTCRLLANKLKASVPELEHRDRSVVEKALADLSGRDPEVRALIDALAQTERPVVSQVRQDVSITGDHNQVITAGRDVTIQGKPGPILRKVARGIQKGTQGTRSPVLDRQLLRRAIIEHFEEDELREMSREFSIDYDLLPGEDKAGRVRELMILLEELHRLPELAALCREKRLGKL